MEMTPGQVIELKGPNNDFAESHQNRTASCGSLIRNWMLPQATADFTVPLGFSSG